MAKKSKTSILGSRTVGGRKITLIKGPKGDSYIAGGKSSRTAFGMGYRPFRIIWKK